MLGERRPRLLEDCAEAALADEHHDGELGVAPSRVPEELVNGRGEAFDARPELALADEEVAPLVADQDVRLALAGTPKPDREEADDGLSRWPLRVTTIRSPLILPHFLYASTCDGELSLILGNNTLNRLS